MYVYIYIYIYMYINIYTHIHTYITLQSSRACLCGGPNPAIIREFKYVVFEDVVFDDNSYVSPY